jgi:prevent-host-death family protein
MRIVASREARTHLSRLIRAVEQGETVVITRHSRPTARLVPSEAQSKADVAAAIERLKRLRRRMPKVPLEELLSWRDEGHKY